MGRRVKVPEAAALTGLSEYAIRQGIAKGYYPHLRTAGSNRGKILIDIDLLEKHLEQEALNNTIDNLSAGSGMVINYGQLRAVKS